MATQICPNCQTNNFTWHMDEDTPLTVWGCHICGYIAYEDESLERECTTCRNKTESRLEDDHRKYWWCSKCNSIKEIE